MGGDAARIENQNLLDAGQSRQARRTITGAVITSAPNKLARSGLISHQRTPISASGAHNEQVAHHQRRTAYPPFAHMTFVVPHDVLRPKSFSRLQVEAVEDSGRA